MTQISAVHSDASARSFASSKSLNDLDLDSFLQLMIAELQNQDPLNPLDNKDMLAQISQIREVGATDRLTETLEAVLLGQNIASATNLIGADVKALSDDNQNIEGIVERVTLAGGQPKLHVSLPVSASPVDLDGQIEAGRYSYRVVWNDHDGERKGIELSGPNAITTTGTDKVDRAIRLDNLPSTPGIKEVYRTDKSGAGTYQLVGVIADGEQKSFVDSLSDKQRMAREQTNDFKRQGLLQRSYEVSMNNVAEIRPPT